ncbi:hypothetical protein [Streptomyces sp. NPDC126499]|uniref:hypothetical protein n=1 Tax=Streptomyces sp. NPDC126499 TaxID=3155314 RepID=UPI00332CF4A0
MPEVTHEDGAECPDPPPGAPSRALRLRAADGWERFMRRAAARPGPESEGRADRGGDEPHPLLGSRVRDIASGGEGVLTVVTHDVHSGGREAHIAHVRAASGVEWTTAVDNIRIP